MIMAPALGTGPLDSSAASSSALAIPASRDRTTERRPTTASLRSTLYAPCVKEIRLIRPVTVPATGIGNAWLRGGKDPKNIEHDRIIWPGGSINANHEIA